MKQTTAVPKTTGQRGGMRLRLVVLLLLFGALTAVSLAGWRELKAGFLERTPPVIELVEAPRGVGLTPVTVKVILNDGEAGLDEVVVRTRQRGPAKEILRRPLEGVGTTEVAIEFPGEKSMLEEGAASLEFRAFDRSFWNNQSELVVPLKVDYRRPKVEAVTAMHNARRGGSQLIFYRAFDEDLGLSGVKVGNQTFPGFPARGIDEAFEDPGLFVAIYAINHRAGVRDLPVRVFAEDQVGNAVSRSFYNRAFDHRFRTARIAASEEFLRTSVAELADANLPRLEDYARASGQTIGFASPKGSRGRLIEKFGLVTGLLREMSENDLQRLLAGPRFERQWNGPFLRPAPTITQAFGDRLTWTFEGEVIGETISDGYFFAFPRDRAEVPALNSGVVVFSESLGLFGRAVGIDHGLGLVSIYGNLDTVAVSRGETVTAGQPLGTAGRSGFSRQVGAYIEVRVHGVPVDPVEWWDRGWYQGHIAAKINEVKQTLGLEVLAPLARGL